jgi:uncharacterized membrane protein
MAKPKSFIKTNFTYLCTVIVSILLVFIGYKISAKGFSNVKDRSQLPPAYGKVLKVIDKSEPDEGLYNFANIKSYRVTFEAKITNGTQKGKTINATQSVNNTVKVSVRDVRKGDYITLTETPAGWYFTGYIRTYKLLILGLLFVVSVLLFGGKKGLNTVLSLGLTCAAVFLVFIPSILTGKNVYVMAIIVCLYTTVMTLSLVVGYNVKSLTAAIGCMSGVLVTGIISFIMDKTLFFTGIIDEHTRHLGSASFYAPINLKGIIFAGIIIGAMGAIMDVAMSMSSALWEVKEKAEKITFKELFRSGLNIGRDVMGTMANTLVLAYISSSLSIVIMLSIYSPSISNLFNSEMIAVEVLQALAGSFGILSAMPLTAFFCSTIYMKNKLPRTGTNSGGKQ